MTETVIVIANWNGLASLRNCLSALRAQSLQNFKVFLVDNGSTDGSVASVKADFPEVQILELDENQGFAEPNNLAIRKALQDQNVQFVVTLNNDTQPEPEYLTEMIACMKRHPDAGSVQPKMMNYFARDVIDSTGILTSENLSSVNRGLKEKDVGQYEIEEEIFGAAASAAIYRREALDAVALSGSDGGKEYFDSDYFAYYEDVDLALRLRLAGYKCYYTPLAKVLHVHSATGKNYSPFKAFHIHRNQYFNIIKNLPLRQLLIALGLMPRLYWHSLLSVVRGKGPAAELDKTSPRNSRGPVGIVIRGWVEILQMLPEMLRKRRQIQEMRVVSDDEIRRWFKEYKADFAKIISG